MEKFVLTDPKSLAYWEKTADLVDQFIDIPLNYRQSGHPGGGSRSKVHMLLSLMLSGAMRWDIRDSDKRFSDKFILGCGHTIPLVYATLAVLNEALRIKYEETKDPKYLVKEEAREPCSGKTCLDSGTMEDSPDMLRQQERPPSCRPTLGPPDMEHL